MANLKGIHFPARKGDLMATARQNGAPDDVLDVLGRMPDDEFASPADVMKAYGTIT